MVLRSMGNRHTHVNYERDDLLGLVYLVNEKQLVY